MTACSSTSPGTVPLRMTVHYISPGPPKETPPSPVPRVHSYFSPSAPDTPLSPAAATYALNSQHQPPESLFSPPPVGLPATRERHSSPPSPRPTPYQALCRRMDDTLAAIKAGGTRLPARVGHPLREALQRARAALEAAGNTPPPHHLDAVEAARGAIDGVDIAFAAAREYVAFKAGCASAPASATGSAQTSLSADIGASALQQGKPSLARMEVPCPMPVVSEKSIETPTARGGVHASQERWQPPPMRRHGSLRARRQGSELSLDLSVASSASAEARKTEKRRAARKKASRAAARTLPPPPKQTSEPPPRRRTQYVYAAEAKQRKHQQARAKVLQDTSLRMSRKVLFTPKGNVKVGKSKGMMW